jgi:manganese efflux pump family protein
MKKIRNFFKVESNFQLLIVNIVFAVTGTISVILAGFILDFIGLDINALSSSLYWTLRVLILMPIYQILLIIIGAVFGEFTYFWRIEKKMLNRLGIKF